MRSPDAREQAVLEVMDGFCSRQVNPDTGQITYVFTESARLRFVRELLKSLPSKSWVRKRLEQVSKEEGE